LLEEIISQVLGPQANIETVHRCVLSILGQCLMYKHSRSVIDRLYPRLIADQSAILESAGDIVQFFLFALNQLAQQKEKLPQ